MPATIKQGSSGNAVKEMQEILIELGYSCGSAGADGKFGSYSDAAVRKFQSDHADECRMSNGKSVDGICGPLTWAALLKARDEKRAAEAKAKAVEAPKVVESVAAPKPPTTITAAVLATAVAAATIAKAKLASSNGIVEGILGSINMQLITIYNLALDVSEPITFYGMYPDEISESIGSEFENVEIKSRSSPLAVYAGGSARTVTLNVDVHEDYLRVVRKGSSKGNFSEYEIVKFVREIKALAYPVYEGNQVKAPLCYVKIGEFFKMKAYCTGVDVSWKRPMRDGYYVAASISISLTELVSQSFDATEVYNGGDMSRYKKYHE